MMSVKVSRVLLTIALFAFGFCSQEVSLAQRGRDPWRLLTTPKFKSVQGKIEVTIFLPEGSRSWTLDLWADENRSRVQFVLPHPEGHRQIIALTLPDSGWVLFPSDKRAIRYEGSGLPTWRDMWQIRTDKLDLAKGNYDLKVIGRDKVAGYFCLVLQLEPKSKGNASRKIWVHPPTRLPLQVERYSPNGQLEIRVAFKEVKINEPLPVLIFDPNLPPDWKVDTFSLQRKRVELSQANEVLGFVPLLPVWLPHGYILEGIFALGDQRWKMAHIVYTDGIGVISVFQHPAPPLPKPRGPFGGQSPHGFGRPHRDVPPPKVTPPVHRLFPQRVLVRNIGNLRVVLVSDVSQEWLEKMADSMMPSSAAR